MGRKAESDSREKKRTEGRKRRGKLVQRHWDRALETMK